MIWFAGRVLVLVAMISASTGVWAETVVPRSSLQVRLSYAPLVKDVAPAVVNIYTRKVVKSRRVSPLFDDPFFRQFFGDTFGSLPEQKSKKVQNSLGSGVITSADGVIITNRHVIEGADDITVVLADRREFTATLLGSDERTDLAVLRIDTQGRDLPFLTFADSDGLEVGDLVLAIGNPFGVGQTVTSGIVSALARTGVGISNFNFFIQTDAAINPGNSGGALVDMDGRLIGVNSAIYSRAGGSNGIGFAIPSNMVRSVLTGLVTQGRLVRPWLGASTQAVTADIAKSLDLDHPTGVLVTAMHKGGPADRGGLRVGDVILTIGGRVVDDPQALRFRFVTQELGSKAEMTVRRKGREVTVHIPIIAPPEEPLRNLTELSAAHPMAGATIANLSPALVEELGDGVPSQGVIIMSLRRGSTSHRLGFKPGDVVVHINGQKIKRINELKKALKPRDKQWRFGLLRKGRELSLTFQR